MSKLLWMPALWLALAIWLAGCATVPFEPVPWTALPDEVDPDAVPEAFAAALPVRFVSEDTLVFRFFWREIAALGYTRIDREAGTFAVICLNHLGVQLFYITGDRQQTTLEYAIPEFADRPEFVEAIGEDIRRLYFDLLPAAEAQVAIGSDRLSFTLHQDNRRVRHIFGGPRLFLRQKRARQGWRRLWDVTYYEYRQVNGQWLPRGMVLRNHRQNYRLTLRIREVSIEDQPNKD